MSSLSNFLVHKAPKSLPWDTPTVKNFMESFSARVDHKSLNHIIPWMWCRMLWDQSFSAPVFCIVTFLFWCMYQAAAILSFGTDGGRHQKKKSVPLHCHKEFFVSVNSLFLWGFLFSRTSSRQLILLSRTLAKGECQNTTGVLLFPTAALCLPMLYTHAKRGYSCFGMKWSRIFFCASFSLGLC